MSTDVAINEIILSGVHVHKADKGRHQHDYYEGDVLQVSVQYQEAIKEIRYEYGKIFEEKGVSSERRKGISTILETLEFPEADDDFIKQVLTCFRLETRFGNDRQFVPRNQVGPFLEGDSPEEYQIYWLWNSEGVRLGLYELVVTLDETRVLQFAIPEPAKMTTNKAKPVAKELATAKKAPPTP